jgi:hypothetical protein
MVVLPLRSATNPKRREDSPTFAGRRALSFVKRSTLRTSKLEPSTNHQAAGCAVVSSLGEPSARDGSGPSRGHVRLSIEDEGVLLFDDTERNNSSPALHTEDSFSFLNRNSGPVWTRIRTELETWYGDFPDADGDLRARFRDRTPAQHFGAWWELYLHRIFSRVGFNVEVHPGLEGSSDRPDFHVSDDNCAFYVEALTVFSGIAGEGRHGPRESEVLEAIEGLEGGIWFLQVNFDRVGGSSPRRAVLRRRLASWLSELDPDVVETETERGAPFPTTLIEVE